MCSRCPDKQKIIPPNTQNNFNTSNLNSFNFNFINKPKKNNEWETKKYIIKNNKINIKPFLKGYYVNIQ